MEFKLRAAVRHDLETDVHVSWCPALGIFSQGTTSAQACAAIKSAVTMWLEYCFSKNILGKALAERGFVVDETAEDGDDAEAEFIDVEDDARFPNSFDLDVPMHLIAGMLRSKETASCPS